MYINIHRRAKELKCNTERLKQKKTKKKGTKNSNGDRQTTNSKMAPQNAIILVNYIWYKWKKNLTKGRDCRDCEID